jgi:hypothetical protein
MRKIRSPLNHQLATETAQADGSVMNQTANGQRFTVRRMK